MAVAYVSDTDQAPATGSSFTYTSFAVSGAYPVILVLIAMDCIGVETVSSVVCSAGLTGTAANIKSVRSGPDAGSHTVFGSVWAISAPSGTGTITVTLSTSRPYQSNAILLSGADQTTPCPTGDAVTATGITPNPLTVTPTNLTADDAAVGIGGNANTGDVPTFNQTQTYNSNTTAVNAAAGYHLGTGAVTVTWGTAGANDLLVAVRVAAAVIGRLPPTNELRPRIFRPGLAR